MSTALGPKSWPVTQRSYASLTDWLNLKDAAELLGVLPRDFQKKAELYGIPPLIVMNKPVYRRKDIEACLERLWNVRSAKPQVSTAQWARSVRATNDLIERLLKESKGDAVS